MTFTTTERENKMMIIPSDPNDNSYERARLQIKESYRIANKMNNELELTKEFQESGEAALERKLRQVEVMANFGDIEEDDMEKDRSDIALVYYRTKLSLLETGKPFREADLMRLLKTLEEQSLFTEEELLDCMYWGFKKLYLLWSYYNHAMEKTITVTHEIGELSQKKPDHIKLTQHADIEAVLLKAFLALDKLHEDMSYGWHDADEYKIGRSI